MSAWHEANLCECMRCVRITQAGEGGGHPEDIEEERDAAEDGRQAFAVLPLEGIQHGDTLGCAQRPSERQPAWRRANIILAISRREIKKLC